jgi:cell division protein FtsW
MNLSRASRNLVAEWWWTVDRLAFIAVIALIGIGLMLAVAASPAASGGPVTEGNFFFAAKQIVFTVLAISVLFGSSLLKPSQVRDAALYVFVAALAGSILVLFIGNETLGARRWLDLGWFSFQPSEFLKPSFAVLAAAILADTRPAPLPRPTITAIFVLPAILVLLRQPDVGQTFLLLALWAAMLFFAGLALKWIWVIGGGAAGLAALAYYLFSHVRHRVDQYFDPVEKGYQAGLSLKAFAHGGLLGVGPGAGTVKYRLPDVHSDYIYAVAGEEFGLALCAVIVVLFCFLAVRLLLRSAVARDPFAQLAGAGLSIVIALQAFINMGVAVNLLPAKGMTLPFISYGGSSLFAVALTMGFALALNRQRPQLELRETPMFPMFRGAGP